MHDWLQLSDSSTCPPPAIHPSPPTCATVLVQAQFSTDSITVTVMNHNAVPMQAGNKGPAGKRANIMRAVCPLQRGGGSRWTNGQCSYYSA